MVVRQSKPPHSGKILSALGRDSSPETSSRPYSNLSGSFSEYLYDSSVLLPLEKAIAAGDQRLDPILASITGVALQLTGASGAALAMWKDGAMVCRARSGDTAPPLGARLSADTGISGECLRTGNIQHCADTENNPLVDIEVCRRLGLRSIAVFPITGWRGINGILEVFSLKPEAFSERHIVLLKHLASLAERARASQPHGASAAVPRPPAVTAKPPSFRLLPASDRVADVAFAFLGTRSRRFVVGAIGLVTILLLALVIWLGWRGPEETESKAHAAAPASYGVASATSARQSTGTRDGDKHLPDNDPVWKPNPGGEALFPMGGKPAAGLPVKFASKVEVIAVQTAPATSSQPDGSSLLSSATIVRSPRSPIDASKNAPLNSTSDESTSAEAPSIPAGSTDESSLNGVIAAKTALPGLTEPSRGVSGGQLIYRVPPVYPAEARLSRLEGSVVLAAKVMEDGTVGEVKVVEGSPVLAASATEAVKRWRYKPFDLDGKPVQNETRITINFKLP